MEVTLVVGLHPLFVSFARDTHTIKSLMFLSHDFVNWCFAYISVCFVCLRK